MQPQHHNHHHQPQNGNVPNNNQNSITSPQILRAPQQQRQHPIRIFHKKSGISKTCSPWLIHGMFLMCQYDGWQSVCQDIFEDYTRMGLSTSSRRIASEAIRILEPQQWGSLVDVYLNPLTLKDLRFISEKDPAIKTFMAETILPSLNPDELSSELYKTPEIIRTALKLYLAIYLPGEISDYVNISIPINTTPICLETIRKITSSSISYIDLPKTPKKPPVQTLSLLMQRMMHSVGVLPPVFDEQRFLA